MADGTAGADHAYRRRRCQQEGFGAAYHVGQVETPVRAGAGDEQRQAVVVAVGVDVAQLDISLGANVGVRAVSYVVQQQASLVEALPQGIVQVGVVRAYGTAALVVGVGVELVNVQLRV